MVRSVIPFKVFATRRGIKARYAAVVLVRVVHSRAVARIVSSVVGVCLHVAVYQSARPTRACSGCRGASSEIVRFSAPVSAPMWLPSIGGGAANAQPVGPWLIIAIPTICVIYVLPCHVFPIFLCVIMFSTILPRDYRVNDNLDLCRYHAHDCLISAHKVRLWQPYHLVHVVGQAKCSKWL